GSVFPSCDGTRKSYRCLQCCHLTTVPASPQPYTLSLHDALPIWRSHLRPLEFRDGDQGCNSHPRGRRIQGARACGGGLRRARSRSEEHTSELQSHLNLVCRLLLETKNERKFNAQRPGRRRRGTAG